MITAEQFTSIVYADLSENSLEQTHRKIASLHTDGQTKRAILAYLVELMCFKAVWVRKINSDVFNV